MLNFFLGMTCALLADSVSDWIYAKAEEIRERVKRMKKERNKDDQ